MEFHFLRPWVLLLLPLVGVLAFYVLQKHSQKGSWEQLMDSHLLSYLATSSPVRNHKLHSFFLAIVWFLATFALAGPTWKKLPQPVFEKKMAQVIVFDLSYSMLATDLTPNRLQRALFKIRDLLDRLQEGSTALIAYAGDAHVIVPLTQDTETIAAMLSALTPEMMPVAGSRPDKAIALAVELLQNSLMNTGSIIWVTDGVNPENARAIKEILQSYNFQLSILAVGTSKGAPISLSQGGLLKDRNGAVVVPRLDLAALRQLSHSFNGVTTLLQVENSDIDILLSSQKKSSQFVKNKEQTVSDQWKEEGSWLVLLLLPLAALGFRRGVFFNLSFLSLGGSVLFSLLTPAPVFALEWDALWKTPYQRGKSLLEAQKPKEAAKTFENPEWKGIAEYQSGNFKQSIKNFEQSDLPRTNFNRGNALARSGKLKEAIAAYTRTLEQNPDFADAQENKNLLKRLLKQQKKKQQKQGKQGKNGKQGKQGEKQQNKQGKQGNQKQSQKSANSPQKKQQQQKSGTGKSNKKNQKQESQSQKAQSADSKQTAQKKKSDSMSSQQKKEDQKSKKGSKSAQMQKMTSEQAQSLEQWLRKIPDDPGALLRNKMNRTTQRRKTAPKLETEYW